MRSARCLLPFIPRAVREALGGKMALGGRRAARCGSALRLGRPALRRPYVAAGGEEEEEENEEEEQRQLLELCRRRRFLRGGVEPRPWRSYLSGCHPGFGPLGAALRGNLEAQWWHSALARREQVFAVDSPLHGSHNAGAPQARDALRLLSAETLRQVVEEPAGPALKEALGSAGTLRETLLPGTARGTAPPAPG